MVAQDLIRVHIAIALLLTHLASGAQWHTSRAAPYPLAEFSRRQINNDKNRVSQISLEQWPSFKGQSLRQGSKSRIAGRAAVFAQLNVGRNRMLAGLLWPTAYFGSARIPVTLPHVTSRKPIRAAVW